jgi:hypothetical protein
MSPVLPHPIGFAIKGARLYIFGAIFPPPGLPCGPKYPYMGQLSAL